MKPSTCHRLRRARAHGRRGEDGEGSRPARAGHWATHERRSSLAATFQSKGGRQGEAPADAAPTDPRMRRQAERVAAPTPRHAPTVSGGESSTQPEESPRTPSVIRVAQRRGYVTGSRRNTRLGAGRVERAHRRDNASKFPLTSQCSVPFTRHRRDTKLGSMRSRCAWTTRVLVQLSFALTTMNVLLTRPIRYPYWVHRASVLQPCKTRPTRRTAVQKYGLL